MTRGAAATPTREQLSGATPTLYWELSSAPERWDALVRSGGGGLLQSWRWGEFKRPSGWSPLRLALRSASGSPHPAGNGQSADGNPFIAAQILFRSLPRLPFPVSVAYIPRGPIVWPGGEQVERLFWKRVHAEARKRGAIFLKVEPPVELGEQVTQLDVDRRISQFGFRKSGRLQPSRTIVLDIAAPEEDLLKAMKPKTRYNIRLAGRRAVIVRRAASLQDLQAFYSLLQLTGERDEFGIHAWDYYAHMWHLFGPQGDDTALVLLADHPDEAERRQGPIAGLVAFRFGREAIYMYGASDNRGREHMPNYLLQWEAIRWAREHGCTLYDFWGIPDPPPQEGDDAELSPSNTRSGLRGVYWFKQGFGGREVEYPGAYDYVYNPLLYKLWMRWRGANLG